MFYVLLFAAAFFFMTADRKIRTSSVAGSCVTFIPCVVLARKILVISRARISGSGGSFYTGFFMTATFCFLLTAVIILLLYFLGRLLGTAVMPVSREGSSNRIVASVFFITGMCLTSVIGMKLVFMSLMLKSGTRVILNPLLRKYAVKTRYYIHDFMISIKDLRFSLLSLGVMLFCILSFCIVRIAVRKGFYRDLKAYVKPDKKDLKRSRELLIGYILSGTGVLGALVIAIVCILDRKEKGRIYFFDGYGYTKALSLLALTLMLAGTVFLIIGIITLLVKRQAKLQKLNLYIASVLIILSGSSSVVLILNAMRYIFKIR